MHSGLDILNFLHKLSIFDNILRFFVKLVNLSEFSFQPSLILKKDILVCNVLLKAYGLAIWEWLFGMGTIFAKLLQEHSWICHITCGFATRDMTNSLVLLQKLCKNCPHPEKLHSLIVALIKLPWWKMLCYLCLHSKKNVKLHYVIVYYG